MLWDWNSCRHNRVCVIYVCRILDDMWKEVKDCIELQYKFYNEIWYGNILVKNDMFRKSVFVFVFVFVFLFQKVNIKFAYIIFFKVDWKKK